MAQLYKMTLYVCDLKDDLSLDEIKNLIEQDALDSVTVNCVCHFADEQTGPQVEWDDDIDLNYLDCLTSTLGKYFNNSTKLKELKYECIKTMHILWWRCRKKIY